MTRSCGKRHAQERREETSARQYVSLCLSRFCCAVEEISERTSWITTAWQKVIRKTSDLYKYSRMINDCPEVPEPVIGFFRVTSYQLQVPVTSESASGSRCFKFKSSSTQECLSFSTVSSLHTVVAIFYDVYQWLRKYFWTPSRYGVYGPNDSLSFVF